MFIPQIGISLFVEATECKVVSQKEIPDHLVVPVEDGVYTVELRVAFLGVGGADVVEAGAVGVGFAGAHDDGF